MSTIADTVLDHPDWVKVHIWFPGLFDDVARITIYPSAAPDIDNGNLGGLLKNCDERKIDLCLDGKRCTPGSKDAFTEAIREWLQTKYDAGDRSFAGLEDFVERAKVEYLQPVEGMT